MKTNTPERNVTIVAAESSEFTISNNSKIFRILIDGLYADKIQSITREIWSNALDAHVQAGCADRPFSVTFPNPFDPTFRVRDYGVSLNHDQVMHMYTDLGNSTKEDTNDAIGKFGIGSKSPFAYTDNFTVTVYLDGEVRFYSAMIGKDGVPSIHLMGQQPTDEENGVEVAFPVEQADARAFQNAAKRISHGFDVKPDVSNMDEFGGWPELDVLLANEAEGWRLLGGAIEGYQQKAYARMGPVLYPINTNALGDITQEQRELLGHTFVIDFDMGDLEITASREELSYGRNDPTAKSILSRIDQIIDGLTERCLEEYAECDTYFDACVKFRAQTHSSQLPSAVKTIIRDKAEWKGRKLTLQMEIELRCLGWDVGLIPASKMSHRVYRFTTSYRTTAAAQSGTIIAVEDLTEGKKVPRAASRLRHYVRESDKTPSQIIWVRVTHTKPSQEEMIKFFSDFDGVEVVMVNDMDVPPSMATGRSGGVRRPVQARYMSAGDFDGRIELDDEDFERGGVYVSLNRMEPVIPTNCASPAAVWSALRELGAVKGDLIGAPKSMWKKFEGDQWVDLYDLAKEYFEENKVDFAAERARREAVSIVRSDDLLGFVTGLADSVDPKTIPENSILLDAVALRDEAREALSEDTRKLEQLGQFLGYTIADADDSAAEMVETLELIKEMITETYPMMEMLSESNVNYHSDMVDKVMGYVVMCDNQNAPTNHQAAIAA